MSVQEVSFVDRFQTTLASSYTAGGGSLSLTSGSGLPSGACYFFLTVRAEGSNTEEVFLVTNRSGTTLTVTGAQANTVASNHASTAVVVASVMPAAAFSKLALQQLDQKLVGTAVATISFSSIPATFTDLILSVNGRSADSNLQDDVYMQLNGDTGSNYRRQYMDATKTGGNASGYQTPTNKAVIGSIAADTSPANYPGTFTFELVDYSGTTFYKQGQSLGGWWNNTDSWIVAVWWNWANASAVTDILLGLVSGANFKTGTKVTLYGRR